MIQPSSAVAQSAISFNGPDLFTPRHEESDNSRHDSAHRKDDVFRVMSLDKAVSVNTCCHELSKQLAILQQRLQFKDD
jgi:hypothetical protein